MFLEEWPTLTPICRRCMFGIFVNSLTTQLDLRPGVNQLIKLSKFRERSQSFSDLLAYSDLVAPGVLAHKDGGLMVGYEVFPLDTTDESPSQSQVRSSIVSRAIGLLGSGFSINIDQCRELGESVDCFENSHYDHPFARLVEEECRELRESHDVFRTTNTIFITYNPPTAIDNQVQSVFKKEVDDNEKKLLDQNIGILETKAGEFCEAIVGCYKSIQRLGPYSKNGRTFDSLLENLNAMIAGERHAVVLPNPPTFVDTMLARECYGGVQLQVEDRHVAIVAVSRYPDDTAPEMFHALDTLGIEYRWSSRYILLSREEAKSRLKKVQRKWRQKILSLFNQVLKTEGPVDEDARQMTGEIDEALARNESGDLSFGYYTFNIILHAPSQEVLKRNVALVKKVVNSAGFTAAMETINALEAFLGSLPGHTLQNIRRPIIHSLNFADLAPARRLYLGEPVLKDNKLMPASSPPLSYCIGSDGSPFFFSNFVADVGNMFCFGPTGSGKTYLLAHIVLSYMRYEGAKIFVFDKGRSLLGVTRACGGNVYDVGAGNRDTCFNPLSKIRESDKEFEWALDWIVMLASNGGHSVSAQDIESIRNGLSLVRDVSAEPPRLSSLIKNLDKQHLKTVLKTYTEGAAGRLLNSETDSLDIAALTSFELEKLVESDHRLTEPVLSYLFHVIERSLTGKPVLVVLDEAWVYIQNPLFRKKLEEYLATFRKSCAAVIFATQSLTQANSSKLLNLIAESCPVKIALPNPYLQSDNEEEALLYAKMGFSTTHLEIIRHATQKRDYLFKSVNGSRLFRLMMGARGNAICSATGTKESLRISKMYREHGESWLEKYLEEDGVTNEKDSLSHVVAAAI